MYNDLIQKGSLTNTLKETINNNPNDYDIQKENKEIDKINNNDMDINIYSNNNELNNDIYKEKENLLKKYGESSTYDYKNPEEILLNIKQKDEGNNIYKKCINCQYKNTDFDS